jgi:hypothetical protein
LRPSIAAFNIEPVTAFIERGFNQMDTSNAARSKEDVALDLLKFVAAHANISGKAGGSTTGFAVTPSAKPEDQVTSLLELYARCREAVEAPIE